MPISPDEMASSQITVAMDKSRSRIGSDYEFKILFKTMLMLLRMTCSDHGGDQISILTISKLLLSPDGQLATASVQFLAISSNDQILFPTKRGIVDKYLPLHTRAIV